MARWLVGYWNTTILHMLFFYADAHANKHIQHIYHSYECECVLLLTHEHIWTVYLKYIAEMCNNFCCINDFVWIIVSKCRVIRLLSLLLTMQIFLYFKSIFIIIKLHKSIAFHFLFYRFTSNSFWSTDRFTVPFFKYMCAHSLKRKRASFL